MTQLFSPESLELSPGASKGDWIMRGSMRDAAMHALARLKRFRAGAITLTKTEINRDLDAVFQFVEQVTA